MVKMWAGMKERMSEMKLLERENKKEVTMGKRKEHVKV